MSERDDYLLDPTREPDPEIAALERALAPLQHRAGPLRQAPPPVPRLLPWYLAAAAALLVGFGAWMLWPIGDGLRPESGKRTFATAKGEMTIPLGDLAEITLRPGSELTFVHWRDDQALFALARGGLTARVQPPPKVQKGFFVVETRLGRVIDQGCQYDLDLREDGSALVHVTEGAVTFTFGERTVFVPAGASTVVGSRGPSTPCFDDAEPELQKALLEFDAITAKGAGVDVRGEALKQVLAAARTPRDTLVLWHLLRDPEPMLRENAEAHLQELVPSPPGAGKGGTADPEEWLPHLRLRFWQAPVKK